MQLGSQDGALFWTDQHGGNDEVVAGLYDAADLDLLRAHARQTPR